MKFSDHRAWQEEFAREEIHADFPPFPRAVVENPFYSDRRVLDRTVWFDLLGHYIPRAAFQHNMPEFMGNEKSTVEVGPRVFVQNDPGLTVEYRTSAFQLRIAGW
jgi:hypothetical protein